MGKDAAILPPFPSFLPLFLVLCTFFLHKAQWLKAFGQFLTSKFSPLFPTVPLALSCTPPDVLHPP